MRPSKYSYLPILFLFFLSLLGCKPPSQVPLRSSDSEKAPPNGYKIGDIYVDKTEVSVSAWKEFQYWHYLVFGPDSYEYIKTLADMYVWEDTQWKDLTFQYMAIDRKDHPKGNNELSYWVDFLPIVGISQQQAKLYTQWRTDRYLEMILIQKGIIKPDPKQNREEHFTLERFVTEGWQGVKPDASIKFAWFRLPDSLDRVIIKDFVYYWNYEHFPKEIVCQSTISKAVKKNGAPVLFDKHDSIKRPKHILGNVSEWAQEENLVYGGSWKDKREVILQWHEEEVSRQAAWIGFRNVSEWVSIGEYLKRRASYR